MVCWPCCKSLSAYAIFILNWLQGQSLMEKTKWENHSSTGNVDEDCNLCLFAFYCWCPGVMRFALCRFLLYSFSKSTVSAIPSFTAACVSDIPPTTLAHLLMYFSEIALELCETLTASDVSLYCVWCLLVLKKMSHHLWTLGSTGACKTTCKCTIKKSIKINEYL